MSMLDIINTPKILLCLTKYFLPSTDAAAIAAPKNFRKVCINHTQRFAWSGLIPKLALGQLHPRFPKQVASSIASSGSPSLPVECLLGPPPQTLGFSSKFFLVNRACPDSVYPAFSFQGFNPASQMLGGPACLPALKDWGLTS